MQAVSFGGNQVTKYDLSPELEIHKINFIESAYSYYFISLQDQASICENYLKSFTILCLKGNIEITLKENTVYLNANDSAQVENHQCEIKALTSETKVLISGVLRSYTQASIITITLASNHKKVVKPWGHELWFNGEHPSYCLKEVMIKQGYRTSLQYHNFKEETNVLLKGQANLIYKNSESVVNENIRNHDLGSVKLSSISAVHITPKIVHRLEALTDVLLYETSTPYLADVIRIQDDKERSHGRIASEHLE